MKMLADLGQNLRFPAEIACTDLRPVEVVFEWKRLRYAELAADVHQWGWRAKTGPVEVEDPCLPQHQGSSGIWECERRPAGRQVKTFP